MLRVLMPCVAASLFLLSGCAGSGDDTAALSGGASGGGSFARSTIYSCEDGSDFIADFSGGAVTLSIASASVSSGSTIVTLKQQRAASGVLYSAGGYEFRGKGNSASLRMPGHKAANCAGMM